MYADSDPELNQWVEMLQSPELEERLVAVKNLQILGEQGATEPLILALQDESTAVQKIAVATLGELASPKAVPCLIECLGAPDKEVRTEASNALSQLVTSDHLLMLLDALHRDDLNMQLNVLILLRKIHDAQALPHLLPFFQSETAYLREAAVTTLSYLNQVERCQPALALMSDPDDNVRCAAALTLGHLADEEVVPLLGKALASDLNWQVRRNAAKSLRMHASASDIPALRTALEDEHWQVRKFAAQVLQDVADDSVLPALVKALSDESSDVRRDAAIALGNLGNPSALNALQQTLDDPDMDVCVYTKRAIQKLQSSVQETAND